MWHKITVTTEQQTAPTLVKFPKNFLVGLLQFQMFFQYLQLSEGDRGGLLQFQIFKYLELYEAELGGLQQF